MQIIDIQERDYNNHIYKNQKKKKKQSCFKQTMMNHSCYG